MMKGFLLPLCAFSCFAQGGPQITSVWGSASLLAGPISPGELVTIRGSNLGPSVLDGFQLGSGGTLRTSIGGCSVLFDQIVAPLVSGSSSQIEAVVPFESAGRYSSQVVVQCGIQNSPPFQVSMSPTTVGIYTVDGSGLGQAAAFNVDAFGNLMSLNSVATPASRGGSLLLYATGVGQTSPSTADGSLTTATLPPPQVTPAPLLPVGVRINGLPALYTYAGTAPGLLAAVFVFVVQIPSGAPTGNSVPISIAVGAPANGTIAPTESTSQAGVTVCVR
jgi:uncharacterized protein (TIGR03437 family)